MPPSKQYRSQAQRAHLERIRSAQLKSQEDGEDTHSDEEVTATSSHSRRLTRAAALKELDILHETVSKYCTDLESYKQVLVQRDSEICDLRDALQSTESQYTKLQGIVSQLHGEHAINQKALVTVERALAKEQHKHITYYKELRNERRKSLRARSSARRESDQAKELREVIIPTANTKVESLESTIQQLQARVAMLEGRVISLEAERAQLRNKLSESRKKTRCFQMQAQRAKKTIGRFCNKASELVRTRELTPNIFKKGMYTSRIRNLARSLVVAGCSQGRVGAIIQEFFLLFGVRVKRMSRRTIQRTILEGGIAAKLQLAHEIGQTKNLTISSDGTSHRHVNFESMHINLTVPDYAAPGISHDTTSSKNQTRLLTVESTANHTSETQLELWKTKINSLRDLYDRSPLPHNPWTEVDFTQKLRGMNGDHAADQKKTFRLVQEWKVENLYRALGKAFLDDHASDDTVISLRADAHSSKITSAGGQDIWDQLPVGEKSSRNALADDTMEHTVGKEVFKILSDEKKREYLWFVRAGCAMHKEMNAMKAGNVALMACWLENDLTPPILLANKDNAAVLQRIDPTADGLSAAEERAMKVSTRGGVKAVSLAGDIFNHKDDKKGQQDTHRIIMEKLKGFISTFPDTSNTRFQSHCLGCIELIVWRPQYIVLLEIVRDKKEKRNFNHMELNLYNALHDVGTLTEMSVIILYHEAISIWYLDFSRSTDLNILDLGPYHDQLKAHIQMLIDNPDLLLCSDATGEKATLAGKSWRNSDAIKAVHELMASPGLPHLRIALIAFLEGNLSGWQRFTAEYEADSLITMSTAEERAMAYMPTTNDANEGALGAMRVFMRNKPTTTMHQYEAQALFRRNHTQDFIDSTIFTGAVEKFCMQEARRIDGQKLEKKRRRELAEHDEREVEETRQRVAAKKAKTAERDALLDAVELILDDAKLDALNMKQIIEQLKLHHRRDNTLHKPYSHEIGTKREQKLAYLKKIVADLETSPEATMPSTTQFDVSTSRHDDVEDSDDEMDFEHDDYH